MQKPKHNYRDHNTNAKATKQNHNGNKQRPVCTIDPSGQGAIITGRQVDYFDKRGFLKTNKKTPQLFSNNASLISQTLPKSPTCPTVIKDPWQPGQ